MIPTEYLALATFIGLLYLIDTEDDQHPAVTALLGLSILILLFVIFARLSTM